MGEGGAATPTLQPAYPFPLLLLSTTPHPSDPAAAGCTVAAPVPDGGVLVVGALVLGEQVSLGLQPQKKITVKVLLKMNNDNKNRSLLDCNHRRK